MCGIVGYTGPDPALPIIIEGLSRLEYRGYDSAGVALRLDGAEGSIWSCRRVGKLAELTAAVSDAPDGPHLGIGHTRWATHGRPSEANAHPHADCSGRLALVHNGIVENFHSLRARLEGHHELRSETDTELLAHLVEERLAAGDDLPAAVRAMMREIEGSLAVAVVHADDPELLVAARRVSPLVAGVSDGAAFVASDIPAILPYTRDLYVIEDDRVVELRPGSVRVTDLDAVEVQAPARHVDWDLEEAEKGGFPDFMLKEIHEQPTAVEETLRGRTADGGRIVLDELRLTEDELRDVNKVFVVACGTSYHAGLVSKYAIEHWTRLPCEIDIASEFRYRDPVLDTRTLVVGVSQSGETADTIAACRYAKRLNARVVAVSNVVDSSMARDADAVLYTHAGPEIGVAATKTHVAQIVALQTLALYLAQVRGTLYPSEIEDLLVELHRVPELIEAQLDQSDVIRGVAEQFADVRDFFFLGRGVGFPVALEGALKLKEISYVRAEAYPGGEMKHGPIALIEPGTVVIGVATRSHIRAKTLSNIEEVRARGATIVLVANEGDEEAASLADHVFEVPQTAELFSPAVDVIPLQLFAYWVAKARGNDVDKPRNLAKTVTVE
ncbi:MAG TPA: glutamine--fructose-6-phosphate transaminase (isomerizing) [Acidimicrobiia bacterium]|nr:glutamine--fructose-6-phosphate transaminase (isomerizing) [Acidimicrobiia bacterium]